ncbi:hypothetical protein WJU23_23175 [Prosthecobacter sp. SYSU 5D2]|uniref:hypothetical protein n=1 Tax=Prosthecobacter sp. SYSU 5D2 TaxID=3134134 RepID=UPI0031FF3621
MKTPLLSACRLTLTLLLLGSGQMRAEDITVYECIKQGEAVTAGKELAVFTTGGKSLMTLYQDFQKTSWTAEPFYGPVIPYLFKDSTGRLFIVHFEFKEGHPVFGEGFRFAIAPLTTVKGARRGYRGSPYNGSSVTDEGLLKQLRDLSVKRP